MASSLKTSTANSTSANQSIPTSAAQSQVTFLDKVNHTLNRISVVSVFAVHFLLVIATIIALNYSYRNEKEFLLAFYNFFFLALFMAVYQDRKPGPLQLATVINLILIVFDSFVVGQLNSRLAQLFLSVNIAIRPLTSVVLWQKSCQQKKRLQLHSSETTPFTSAIENLLHNPSADAAVETDLEGGKVLPLSTQLSPPPPNSRQ